MTDKTTQELTPTETSTETLETTQVEALHDKGDTPADHKDSLDIGNIFTTMADEDVASDLLEDSPAVEATTEEPVTTPPETPEVTPAEAATETPAVVESVVESVVATPKVDGETTAKPTTETPKEPVTVAPETPPAAVEPVVPTEETSQARDELLTLLNERRGETIDVLAKNHFALDDEQFREFDENPREFLPKLMGSLYLDSVQGAVSAILGQIPQIVSTLETRKTEELAAENKFYTQFPKLAEKPEFKEHVRKVSIMHRQLNPKATKEDMIRDVGLQASVAFKLPVPESVRETGKSDTVIPHVPVTAVSQAPAVTPGGKVAQNPFTEMAEDMLEDDAR